MTTHTSILAWEILDRGPWRATAHGVAESDETATEREHGGITVVVFGELPSSLIRIPLSLE